MAYILAYVFKIGFGLASVGNDAVKHANHCVRYTTRAPFLDFLAAVMAGGRGTSFVRGGEPQLRIRGIYRIT